MPPSEVPWWQVPVIVYYPPRPWSEEARRAANARLSRLEDETILRRS